MSKMAKVICLFLALVFSMSLLAGCGSNNATQDKTASKEVQSAEQNTAATESTVAVKEPVTLKWLGAPMSSYLDKGLPDDRVAQELIKRTGVTIDWSLNIGVADTNDKMSILLASGDLPDIVLPVNNQELENKLKASKAVITLDELVKSNGQDIIKNASNMLAFNRLSKSDATNALYCISLGVKGPANINKDVVGLSWQIRWDLYKKLNYPKLENYDDFLNVLIEMQKIEPTNKDGKKNYGLGLFLAESWGAAMLDRAMMFEQGLTNLPSIEAAYANISTYEVIPRVTDPDGVYWKSLAFYNKAFRMGVLDPETATLKFQTFLDKANAGRYFAAPQDFMIGGADNTLWGEKEGKGYCPVLIEPNKDGIWSELKNDSGMQYNVYITTNCKNPERAMDLLNYSATYEGEELILNGIEGKDWKMENGIPVPIGEALDAFLSKKDIIKESGINKYTSALGVLQDSVNPKGYFTIFTNNIAGVKRDIYEDYKDHFKLDYVSEYVNKYPNHAFDNNLVVSLDVDAADTEMSKLKLNFNNYVNTQIAKVVFQKTEEGFNAEKFKIISDLNGLGADKLIKYASDKFAKQMSDLDALNKK